MDVLLRSPETSAAELAEFRTLFQTSCREMARHLARLFRRGVAFHFFFYMLSTHSVYPGKQSPPINWELIVACFVVSGVSLSSLVHDLLPASIHSDADGLLFVFRWPFFIDMQS
jgi:hypothetical protein